MNKLNILLMGMPGAGKGTQAQKIVEDFNILHISTGDIFRTAISNQTEVGLEAKKFMDNGNLVPDEVTNKIVEERLSEHDVDNGYILDGFPRNVNQAKALDDMTNQSDKNITAVINIKVGEQSLIDRLSGRFICKNCGAAYHKLFNPPKVENTCDVCKHHEFYQREDDKPEAVKTRIELSLKINQPLLDFYKEKKILYNIDGDQKIDNVYQNVKVVLDNLEKR